MKIKNYPEKERPREKAYYYGIDSLTNNELLALILRTGSKKESALQLAQRVINEVGGLAYLKDVTYHQLVSINSIKKAKAISIRAVIELTKRIKGVQKDQTVIKEPKDGYYLVKDKLMFEQQEHVHKSQRKYPTAVTAFQLLCVLATFSFQLKKEVNTVCTALP